MKRVTTTVDVDVYLEDFSDEDLVDEVVRRKLIAEVIAQAGGKDKPTEIRDVATDALQELLGGRGSRAMADINKLIAMIVPAEILAARDAIAAGRSSDAICEIDRFIAPTPAASAQLWDIKRQGMTQ